MTNSAKLAMMFPLLGLLGCESPYRASTNHYPNPVISSPPNQSTATGAYQGSAQTWGSGTQTYGSTASTAQQNQSLSAQDQALVDRVQQALRSNGSVSGFAQNLQVTAQNGAVTLTGAVPADQERQTVDNVVRTVSGVTGVYDHLQIQPSATGRSTSNTEYETQNQNQSQSVQVNQGSAPNVATGDIFSLHVEGLNQTDRSLAERILQGLQTDQAMASLMPKVSINVGGGRVLLQGNVQSEQQKQSIGNVVQRAAGGNNVDNQLTITGQ